MQTDISKGRSPGKQMESGDLVRRKGHVALAGRRLERGGWTRNQDSYVGGPRRREAGGSYTGTEYVLVEVQPSLGAVRALTTRTRNLQRTHMFCLARRQDPGLAPPRHGSFLRGAPVRDRPDDASGAWGLSLTRLSPYNQPSEASKVTEPQQHPRPYLSPLRAVPVLGPAARPRMHCICLCPGHTRGFQRSTGDILYATKPSAVLVPPAESAKQMGVP